jgi:hypothetical protein
MNHLVLKIRNRHPTHSAMNYSTTNYDMSKPFSLANVPDDRAVFVVACTPKLSQFEVESVD